MSNPFKKPSDFAGGSYFKPAEHMNTLALLIEPKRLDKDVPSSYQGQSRTRDEVTADITVFATEEALEKGEPTEVAKATKVTHTMLVDTLSKIIGDPMIAVVRKISTTGGTGYVFRDLENAEHIALAAKFYENRNAELEAALADVPDFD